MIPLPTHWRASAQRGHRERQNRMEPKPMAEELLQGQLELWHHALGYIKPVALKCAMDLGIADAIVRCGGTATLRELLAATDLPPCNLPYLRRIMRVLTFSRIFAPASGGDGDEAVYKLTAASRLLVGKVDAAFCQSRCVRALVNLASGSPMLNMHPWITDERAAAASMFQKAHGVGQGQCLWKTTKKTAMGEGFYKTMAADSSLFMHAVLTLSPAVFQGAASLVDVGGAYGAAAAAVAMAFPHMECTVLDLPHVVAEAPAPADAAGVRFVAGDMFQHIPPADVVLLKWILHDWNNDECVKILRECKKAVNPGGKVVIIDTVIGSKPCDSICDETQVLLDMHMMIYCNGVEREEHEWRCIFLEAGFLDFKIAPTLGFRSVIELYP